MDLTERERRIAIFIAISFLLGELLTLLKNKRNFQLYRNDKEEVFPIDINKAELRELMKIPGVGRKIASEIIKEREKRGRFRRIEELLEIKGIGKKNLKIIKKYIKVGNE